MVALFLSLIIYFKNVLNDPIHFKLAFYPLPAEKVKFFLTFTIYKLIYNT